MFWILSKLDIIDRCPYFVLEVKYLLANQDAWSILKGMTAITDWLILAVFWPITMLVASFKAGWGFRIG
jgi:hypothetical protein